MDIKNLLEQSGASVVDYSGNRVAPEAIQNKIDTQNQANSVQSQVKHLSEQGKLEWLLDKKSEGNFLYKEKHFERAVSVYMEALVCAKLINHQESIATVLCNLSSCMIGLNKLSEALKLTEEALKVKNDSARAWERSGYAKFLLGRDSEAHQDWNKALELATSTSLKHKIHFNLKTLHQKTQKLKTKYSKLWKSQEKPPELPNVWVVTLLVRVMLLVCYPVQLLKKLCSNK